jgi:hypothetical protein
MAYIIFLSYLLLLWKLLSLDLSFIYTLDRMNTTQN